eukprot:4627867-Pyramimonas_sp.AAC.1
MARVLTRAATEGERRPPDLLTDGYFVVKGALGELRGIEVIKGQGDVVFNEHDAMVEGRRVGDPSRRVVELSGRSSDALHEDIGRVTSSSIEKASGGVLRATDLTYLKEGMVRITAEPHLEVAQMEH